MPLQRQELKRNFDEDLPIKGESNFSQGLVAARAFRLGKFGRQNFAAVGIQNLKLGPNQSKMLQTNIAWLGVSIESLLFLG